MPPRRTAAEQASVAPYQALRKGMHGTGLNDHLSVAVRCGWFQGATCRDARLLIAHLQEGTF
jgi:hypothetical protein